MLKHLWFDMAGTLYREDASFQAAHNELRYATYAQATGQTDLSKAKAEYEALYAQHGSNSAAFMSLGKPSDFWQKAFDGLGAHTLLAPDESIAVTLASIKHRVPISVFSNFYKDQILATLAHLHIPAEYFTHIVSGDEVAARKPALDGFYKMVELSGVPAGQTMYVGDRVDVDIRPAKQVGMQTCLVYGQSDVADFCIQNLAELPTILRTVMPGRGPASSQ